MNSSLAEATSVGYQQTEIGVFPNDWNLVEIDSIAKVVDGDRGHNYPGADDFGENGYCLFLNAGNVTNQGFKFETCAFISREKDKRLSKGKLHRKDIVLTTRGTVGNFALFNEAVPFDHMRINSGMVILRNDDDSEVETDFLYAFLRSHSVEKQIERLAFGSAQPQLTVKGISKLLIALPPTRKEQCAVAEALGDVDTLLNSLDRLIAKRRDLKQAAMQQLLSGRTRLPGFEGEWKTLNMSENSTLKARIGWQGLTTAEYLQSGKYFLVTGTDFANGRIEWATCSFVAYERYAQDKNIQLRGEDILLTKDGTIGKIGFISDLPGPATLNSGVFVIRPRNDSYDPSFFYYVLSSRIFDDFLTKLQAGSTISHLYQKDFVTFSFLAPPTVDEQKAIADALADMDTELAALQQRREKTTNLKHAMMQELLTGKTRLV